MILTMSTETAVMIWKAVEKFFRASENELFIQKTSFFKLFEWPDRVLVGIKTEKSPIAHVCDYNIFLKRCMTILFSFAG